MAAWITGIVCTVTLLGVIGSVPDEADALERWASELFNAMSFWHGLAAAGFIVLVLLGYFANGLLRSAALGLGAATIAVSGAAFALGRGIDRLSVAGEKRKEIAT